MQLYILNRDPQKNARLLPEKLGNNNYAQKMLIELCQCLSNLLGNKYVNERFYKYKAVPPEFTAFIFQNQKWVYIYARSLLNHCCFVYDGFENKPTYINCSFIINEFSKLVNCQQKNIYNAWFIPSKEYGKREYLPIDECIEKYDKYLDWKYRKTLNK